MEMIRGVEACKSFSQLLIGMRNIIRSGHVQHKTTLPRINKSSMNSISRERQRVSKDVTLQMKQTVLKIKYKNKPSPDSGLHLTYRCF